MSPHTLLLFFVVTSDSENRAYLNERGGAMVTRSRRLDIVLLWVPTVPIASIWYRFRDWATIRYWYVPSVVVPDCVVDGTTPLEFCRYAIAWCTPDSATWRAWPHERPLAELVWSWNAMYIVVVTNSVAIMLNMMTVMRATPSSSRRRKSRFTLSFLRGLRCGCGG